MPGQIAWVHDVVPCPDLFSAPSARQAAARLLRLAAFVLLGTTLAACSDDNSGGSSNGTTAAYSIGGTVSGLTGSGLVIQDNSGDDLTLSTNGSFTFHSSVASGGRYSVSVFTQPTSPAQTCAVSNGAGQVSSANVTNVTVACANKTATQDKVGGTVSGLKGSGLVLQNNGGDDLPISADGPFVFAAAVAAGTPYSVSVKTVPTNPYQDCSVSNGGGTAAETDVTNITVTCRSSTSTTAYTVGGTLTWPSGGGSVVLQVNGLDNLTVTSDGSAPVPFTFKTPIPTGSAYVVTAQATSGSQDISHTCALSNASGVMGSSNVTNVAVACGASSQVQLTVAGLSGHGLTLQDGAGSSLPVSANGTVSFPTALSGGAAYNITVASQPTSPWQTCVLGNGSGTVPSNGLIAVSVTCTTNTYAIGGTVTGFADEYDGGAPLVLQDNAGDNLTINADGAFQFNTPVASTGTYSVTVLSQPGNDQSFGEGQQTDFVCTVDAGTGTVTNAAVASVKVTCVYPGGFAYVTNATDNTVSSYVIDGFTGALVPFGTVAAGSGPAGVNAYAQNGPPGFVYVANAGSSNLDVFQMDTNTGVLGGAAPQVYSQAGATGQNSITFGRTDPGSGDTIAYVTNGGSGTVSSAIAAPDGTLAFDPTQVYATAAQPIAGSFESFNFGEDDNALYVLNASGTLTGFTVRDTGADLTPANNPPTAPTGPAPTAVVAYTVIIPQQEVVVPVVYVGNSGNNTISRDVSDFDGNANLTSITADPNPTQLPAGGGPISLAIDPTGSYLFAANSSGVWVYSIDPNNARLTLALAQPVPVGTGPHSMSTYGVSESYVLYVTNSGDGTVSAFTIDFATGQLTPVPGSPFKAGKAPSSIVSVQRPEFLG